MCGRELGLGPWWMTAPGRGVHEECAAWGERPYPFAAHLRRLRALRAKLGHAVRAVELSIEWFERMQGRWPSDAQRILRRARRWQAALEQRLRELGFDRRG